MIEGAIDQGLPLRIATKYWMEQLGLPFHPRSARQLLSGERTALRAPQQTSVWFEATARQVLFFYCSLLFFCSFLFFYSQPEAKSVSSR